MYNCRVLCGVSAIEEIQISNKDYKQEKITNMLDFEAISKISKQIKRALMFYNFANDINSRLLKIKLKHKRKNHFLLFKQK